MTATLAHTQARMQAAITGPIDIDAPVRSSSALSAEQRLDLYRRTYWNRLFGCMRDSFPGVRNALGDDLFIDFAAQYLHDYPPVGTSLNPLGKRFAEFLEATRPPTEPRDNSEASWPDFLVDLASLEWLFLEIYDGPGTENVQHHQLDDLVPLDRLSAAPCLGLLSVNYPVDSYLLEVRSGKDPDLPTPMRCHLALTRVDWEVRTYRLTSPQSVTLSQLKNGHDATSARPDHLSDATYSRWFSDWLECGLVVAEDNRLIERMP